jgi:hypothetical protein
MAIVWELDLKANEKFVLLAYADHADDDGDNVYPSLGRVARKTGYSRDQVRRISRQLVDKRLMEMVAKATPTHAARYRLTLGEGGSKLPPLTPRGVGANDPSGVGAPMQPEPSEEPSYSRRDADASKDIMKNPFGYYCKVADALEVDILPEDRDQTSKHFKDLVRNQQPSKEELRRVVSKMLEARTAGVFWSPQKTLEIVRGDNVTPFRRKQQEASHAMSSIAGYKEFS